MLAVRQHLTPKMYVGQVIFYKVYEPSLLRLNPHKKLKLGEQDSKIPNSTLTSPKTIIKLPTKSYVDSLQECSRKKRDLSSVLNDQDNELTTSDKVSVNRDPTSDNELANKKYIDDPIGQRNVRRFNQTLQNHLKVSVGKDKYSRTKNYNTQFTVTAIGRYPNTGSCLPQNWVIECNDKNNNGKTQNIIKSTKTNSSNGYSGAESLPPIGNSFQCIDTSSNNHGNSVFVSFERTDVIQISNLTISYNRYSIITNEYLKSVGRFKLPLLLGDNTWSTRYKIPKNDRYDDSPTQWIKLGLNFTEEN